jgi:molybdate transport repressor ModE-like protein
LYLSVVVDRLTLSSCRQTHNAECAKFASGCAEDTKMAFRFDLIDLRLFLHVAEAASITHGARSSNMSLASASERIRDMEAAFGAPLLERRRRGVDLTPAGSVLVQHAHIVMQQLEQMSGELDSYAKGVRGHVRLLSNTVGMLEYLPAALASFLSAHPNVDVDLDERPSRDIVPAIASGHADIGIIAGAIDPGAELETFPFAENLLVLVVPRGHALSRRRAVSFNLALEHDFVGLGVGSALQEYVKQQAQRAARRLKVRVRLGSFDVICQMVEHGIGIAVLPEAAARRWQRSMAIAIVALTDAWAVRHLQGCVRSLKALPPHAQRLVEFLRSRPLPSK